ncbi:hypothetical protein HanPI659440_Chr11g0434221 [Helianthus annuus]|nr:hypothetical protein HanPI659440_Chr11g0434221 [Helianthus annuus]
MTVTTFVTLLFVVSISISVVSSENHDFHGAVFNVRSKFSAKDRSISSLKAHDSYRHFKRVVDAGVDVRIGGSGRPDSVGYIGVYCIGCGFEFR